MSKTVNYKLVKYEKGELLYLSGEEYPTGYLYLDTVDNEWCVEYHDSNIGHSMISTKEEAIAMILEHA